WCSSASADSTNAARRKRAPPPIQSGLMMLLRRSCNFSMVAAWAGVNPGWMSLTFTPRYGWAGTPLAEMLAPRGGSPRRSGGAIPAAGQGGQRRQHGQRLALGGAQAAAALEQHEGAHGQENRRDQLVDLDGPLFQRCAEQARRVPGRDQAGDG